MPKSSIASRTPSALSCVERAIVARPCRCIMHALGDLEDQASRLEARLLESARGCSRDEVGLLRAGARERFTLIVSGSSVSRSCQPPPAGRPRASTQRPSGTISPVSSASGMNVDRRQQPALRVVPADQRLDAGDAPGRERRRSAGSGARARRARARAARSASSSSRSTRRACMLGSKTAYRALAAALGRVHRDVGVAQQLVGGLAPACRDGDADAGARRAPPCRRAANGLAQRLDDALGHVDRRRVVVGVLEQDRELVAAEARGGVAGADAAAAAARRPRTSSSSPAAWPRLSLTVLKSSRSMKSTATVACRRSARASACRRGRGTARGSAGR